ncbi:MAG: hypothetical protein RL381_926 [Actinomycetota bacterium]
MPLVSAPIEGDFAQNSLHIQRCGVTEYREALALQRTIHQQVVEDKIPNSLLMLEHPSVYTAGKRTTDSERPQDGTEVIDVDRGGKITWHGPGQLVGYPIVKLAQPTELVAFVREIEAGLIDVCAEFGISAERVSGRSGVWVRDPHGDRKIAAIGIRVAKGVSMHGFALNVNPELSAFNAIIPCGISDADVTSMALELGREITIDDVIGVVEKKISQTLMKVSA